VVTKSKNSTGSYRKVTQYISKEFEKTFIGLIQNFLIIIPLGWPVPNCPVECYFKRDGILKTNRELLDVADGVFYYNMDNAVCKRVIHYL
jgi:hypothetical protein